MSSFSAFAGGGATWSPSVAAAQCIEFTGEGFTGGYKWNNSPSCNEVISKGYALGAQVSGKVVYKNGDTLGFSGLVKPGSKYIIKAPETYNGYGYRGLADTFVQWFK